MSAPQPLPFAPEAVVFDMDGLLLDSERIVNACMADAARGLGFDMPESLWLRMIGGSDADCNALLGEHVGADAALAVRERAEAAYASRAEAGIPHRPGVAALLDFLDARNMPRAIATSTRRPLAVRKLAAAGLLERFAAVCTSSDVALPKPAPDVYLLAAAKLGADPARCLALEDSPTGVRAALAAGMAVIQVPDMLEPDDETRALGHRIVGSLGDVQRLLEERLVIA